ncbi:hypothetical protein JVU11DRAFT_10662 [Chiua virens]|nr:hypothetical protein JVU11DRAFT_10662 [Chiua virens]
MIDCNCQPTIQSILSLKRDLGIQHKLTDPINNEALLALNVAHACCEVCRAEQVLAACLTHEHESMAKLYEFKANSRERKVHNMDMNVGSMRVTMKWCGMAVDFVVPPNVESSRFTNITVRLD